jgi:hypothetical protein
LAVASPIPLLPPVINASFPASLSISVPPASAVRPEYQKDGIG